MIVYCEFNERIPGIASFKIKVFRPHNQKRTVSISLTIRNIPIDPYKVVGKTTNFEYPLDGGMELLKDYSIQWIAWCLNHQKTNNRELWEKWVAEVIAILEEKAIFWKPTN